MLANLLSVLSLLSLVSAHGIVTSVTIGGTRYAGPSTGSSTNMNSPIRQVAHMNPNLGANNAAITCGPNARPAKAVANVAPGARIQYDWRMGGQAWPHNTGPMITYLARCNGDCRTFNATNAQWFKIHYAGYSGGKWQQATTIYTGAGGKTFGFNFPQNVAPGGYLMRHEVIALHLAGSRRGAEFYPSCTQINVTGSGRGAPAANELVRFPGAYSDDDAGIWCRRNEQFGDGKNYVEPGPKISKLAVQAPATNGNSNNATNTPPANAGSTPAKCTVNKKRSPAAKRLRRAKRDHAKRRQAKRVDFESSA